MLSTNSTSILVHTFLYYRKSIWNQARRSLKDEEDIHAKRELLLKVFFCLS